MCKEEIIRVYEKRFKKLSKHYNKLLKDFDREEIHLFRLELKKLRAFTRLVTHAMFRDHFKIHGQLKAFYNAAGDLRNIQLHLERVSEISRIVAIELPAAYLQLLLDEEIKAQKNLRHHAHDLSLKGVKKRLIENCPVEITGQSCYAFLLQKKAQLEALILQGIYSDECLHEIRKHLKDLLYNWKYIEEFAPAFLPPIWTEKEFIDKLAAAIGEFYDKNVSLSFLSPEYIAGFNLTTEQFILHELKTYLENEKDHLKSEIIDYLVPIRGRI